MKNNSNMLSTLREYFEDKPIVKAYLFGSCARNEDTSESDIDILVELDYSKTIGLKFIKMQIELERLLNRKVDLLSANAVSRYIKPFLYKDLVKIYEK